MSTARTIRKIGKSGTTPLWLAEGEPPRRPPLKRNARADVCVVGGGIAGMTTAYLLARERRNVVLLDAGPLAAGETSRTTAHLSNAMDAGYAWIEEAHGTEGARLAAESHSAAIDRIETIVAEEGIDCDFDRVDGFLFNPPGEAVRDLERELTAARRAGLSEVERLPEVPGPLVSGDCLRFPRQAQFHPLRYLSALADAFERLGGRIHTGSKASAVEGGAPARVRLSSRVSVTADTVVVATNVPIHTRVAVHAKQAAYRTYALAFAIPEGAVPPALYWDTLDPYHYVRTARDDGEPVLIVGGEDHKTGQEESPADCFGRLEAWAHERFRELGPLKYRWSGQVVETVDGLAYIGRSPSSDGDTVLLATGDCGMGMTHGTIAGILLTDRIQGRENPWAGLYDPARKTLRAAPDLVRENVNAAARYAGFLTPGEVDDTTKIPPGSGAILRRGPHKLAIYRAPDGELIERSAVCPHLGCLVAWNALEHSWDCPCHGSRFDATGKRVLNGPAGVGLGDPS
jgi:glycine/D-amino acid oxidase-like deaminating enzyme/nitrite reductase/ring-hydroxylating ferredoxin subunit